MDKFFLLVLCLFSLVFPVAASDIGIDGGDLIVGVIESSDPAVSLAEVDEESSLPSEEVSQDPAALAGSDTFTGGYWFVCDCALGYDLKFYIPSDWASDQFTLDASGAPVNMSNSTVYAYCPDFPDYTFSCSRFSSFVYRQNNYSNEDLKITKISDTNIDFLEDDHVRLSDYDLKVLGCSLIFLVAAILIFKRG